MVETKHTPGPWNVSSLNMHRKSFQVSVRATCYPEPKVAEATALLIGAAPELLAALKKALAEAGCDGDLCAHEWHEVARRAIAKAEGRANG